ncbi:ABC transporter ATP-binding protein [Oenococcus sp. UCMA 16435]|nr:ABC transporter ATP-binding protein [Oenococcus sp. UCMA 16435]MDI4583864.1 ATP-binding cassette domain-containing protein [Oenococcus sp. UCMA 14587]
MLIELKNICKSYDNKIIFDGFSNKFESGSFTAIKGPSGIGKTTLLDIIGLLIKPDDGEYFIDGVPMIGMKAKKLRIYYRKVFGFVFQDYGLMLDETVLENLKLSTKFLPFSNKRKKIESIKALIKVGLNQDYYQMPVYELSGGQQQRVALARLLLKKTSIILADEPTGSLDRKNGEQVMDILSSFAKKGCIVITVTHSNQYDRYFDRIIQI